MRRKVAATCSLASKCLCGRSSMRQPSPPWPTPATQGCPHAKPCSQDLVKFFFSTLTRLSLVDFDARRVLVVASRRATNTQTCARKGAPGSGNSAARSAESKAIRCKERMGGRCCRGRTKKTRLGSRPPTLCTSRTTTAPLRELGSDVRDKLPVESHGTANGNLTASSDGERCLEDRVDFRFGGSVEGPRPGQVDEQREL